MMTRTHQINDMALGDLRPEKAGVGGSVPSLATITDTHLIRPLEGIVPGSALEF